MRRLSEHSGVALLEVLLAVTVVGVGMGASFRSFSDSSRLQSLLERKATARNLATEQLFVLRTSGALRDGAETSGQFSSPYEEYAWTVRMQSSVQSASRMRVQLDVTYGSEDKHLYTLDTYLFGDET